ncbi:MAG TPA: hypothetical protein PLV06_13985 [Bacteroidales bacterium]|nr:hypothetical protein [Bacteroidales bacterium]
MKKPELVILANEVKSDHELWVRACERRSDEISFRVVDLTSADWYENVFSGPVDCLLPKPGGLTLRFKKLYDERLSILVREKHLQSFPALDEVLIHENKVFQSYWLKAGGLPHPATHVFYYREEAEDFAGRAVLPLVAKLNIGSSGKGVEIIRTQPELKQYVREIFASGRRSRSGPNLSRGGYLKRAAAVLSRRGMLREKLSKYSAIRDEVQKGYVLFQEYVPHEYEWRAVRIGDSFFAHKKMRTGDKASGSLKKGYGAPPRELLDFVRTVTDRFGFRSMSADLFEPEPGRYLINEMQCIFGQSDPHQMIIEGRPGRYRFRDDEWVFEEGDFASNQCFDLRVDHVIDMLKKR